MTASFSFIPGTLPDTGEWFANAAAWNNYWAGGVTGTVTFNIITTTYTSSPYNSALVPCYATLGDVNYVLATNDMFQSLLTMVNTLNTSYAALRTALFNAGLISNA